MFDQPLNIETITPEEYLDKPEENNGDELNIAINEYIDTNTEDMKLILVEDPVQSERIDKPTQST